MTKLDEILKLYPDIDFNNEGGSDAYKEDLPIIERDPIAVIIKHPTDDLYLISKFKGVTWNGFLTGGIEEGDTLEDTVRKEIHEETGYKNIAKITPINFTTHALFFHPVKNVNRLAHYHLVIAKLANLEKDEVSEEEKNIADFEWVRFDDVLPMITRKGMILLWQHYMKYKFEI